MLHMGTHRHVINLKISTNYVSGAKHCTSSGEGGEPQMQDRVLHAHPLPTLGHGQDTSLEGFLPSRSHSLKGWFSREHREGNSEKEEKNVLRRLLIKYPRIM